MTNHSRAYYKRRRSELFKKQNGKCHWCACDMIEIDYEHRVRGSMIPPNALTLDHLRDRLDPFRQSHAHNEKRWVAACRSCNHKRGRERVQAIPIEEQWRRAGHLERMISARKLDT